MLGSGVQTSLHPPGLWRPLPSPPTRNEQTNPFARLLMGSLLWRHANHPHSPPQLRSAGPGIDSTERHTPTKRAPWRSGASLPIAEMEVALRSRMPAAPPMVQCPSVPATASVPGCSGAGRAAGRKDGRRVRIAFLRCCCEPERLRDGSLRDGSPWDGSPRVSSLQAPLTLRSLTPYSPSRRSAASQLFP